MARAGTSLPRRVLGLQIVLSSLLFLLSCQELRASSLPDRRIRRDSEAATLTTLPNSTEQANLTNSLEELSRQLLESAEQGNLTMVQRLVQAGANLTATTSDAYGRTALHLAALNDSLEVVQELLRAGVDPDVKTSSEDAWTALHLAVYNNYLDVVKELLRVGANTTVEGSWLGFSPLIMASLHGRLEVVRVLLEHGVDPNLPNRFNRTALHQAALRGHDAVVELLMNNSAECEVRDHEGYTPLLLAVSSGHTATLRLLAGKGCQIHTAGNGGNTPLHSAAFWGRVETLRALMELGYRGINMGDKDGDTPLHGAVRMGKTDAVRALVELGADINLRNKKGKTPLTLAREWGGLRPELVRFLESQGATA